MSRGVMDLFRGGPHKKKGEDLTQSSRRKMGKRIGRAGQAPPLQACIDAVLRGMSEVAFLRFVEKIFGGSTGERHDRQRRIFVRVRDQSRASADGQILHVVRL